MGRAVFNWMVSLVVLALALSARPLSAQQLSALARLDVAGSGISQRLSGDVDIVLSLSQAVPWRVFTLDDPMRMVVDFRKVDFPVLDRRALGAGDEIAFLRTGIFRPGWSRMVVGLARPMRVFSAAMKVDPASARAVVHIRLTETDAASFARQAGMPQGDGWALPGALPGAAAPPAEHPAGRPSARGDGKIVIALDPGHGGIDPGAEYQGYTEAGLMLTLARQLRERLIRTGRFQVVMTRDSDMFMSLQGRITRARAAGADAFISLHADALARGTASGTTVYTLSKVASDQASALLAASHDRDDLLAGVDLKQQDDVVASVLMDMARVETGPRSEKLADAVVKGIARAVGRMRMRPRLSAGFSVLKAPDIPSILVEFGFMSNPRDLALLTSRKWRAKMIDGLVAGLQSWVLQDAAEARLLRR